jgi:hypothetical protein
MNDFLHSAQEFPATMVGVIGRVESALAEQRQIEAALATARAAEQEAARELHEAQAKLSVAESGAAIGASDLDKLARKRVLAARDECEFVRARVSGLADRGRTVTAMVNEAQKHLAVEFRNWKRDQAAVLVDSLYQPALNALLDAMRTLVAAGTALGVNRLLAIPRQAFLPDHSDPVRNRADRKRLGWQNCPESLAHYERLSALCGAITPLPGEFRDASVAPPAAEEGAAAA